MVTASAQLESGMTQYASQDGTQNRRLPEPAKRPRQLPRRDSHHGGDGPGRPHEGPVPALCRGRATSPSPPTCTRGRAGPAPERVLEVLFSVPDSQTMGDLEGAALFLKNNAHANGKVGIIGFCSGGRYTLMFGCTSSNVNAAVDSAGGHIIPDEVTEARPVGAIDMVANLNCPLLALFGEEDPNPSPEHAARLRQELGRPQQGLRVRNLPQRGPRLLRRLPPQLPRGPRPGHVASRVALLREAP